MLWAKVDRLDGQINFVQKTPPNCLFWCYTNMGYLSLEGPKCQTIDTRSGVFGFLGVLCGRSVASNLIVHEAAAFPPCFNTGIGEKVIFLAIGSVPENLQWENFFGAISHRILTHSENVLGLRL